MSRSLRRAVQECISSCRALDDDFRLVLGLSGGPDSLALLHLLLDGLMPASAIIAAHLNHRLRPEADSDAGRAAQICRDWGVECRIGVADVRTMMAEEHLSLEDAARRARYRFLAQSAQEAGMRVVAVGHQADDQVETVLLHLLRGSGPGGLRGMSPIGKLPLAPHITLMRPLLQVDREEVMAYCHAHNLQPLTDESNFDVTLLRNRVRHELLPLLESYNPGIRKVLRNQATILGADFELLEAMLQEVWQQLVLAEGAGWLRLDLTAWSALPLSLRRAALRQALAQVRGRLDDAGFQTVESARLVLEQGTVGAQASLPGALILTLGYDDWVVAAPDVDAPLPLLPQVEKEGVLQAPGCISLANGWEITAEYVDGLSSEELLSNPDRWVAFVPARASDDLRIRGRISGELFQPLGMGGRAVSVKKYMINAKMPASLRARWPIVAGEHHPVWLVGHRTDERARCRAGERVVRLACRREAAS